MYCYQYNIFSEISERSKKKSYNILQQQSWPMMKQQLKR